MSLEKIGIKRIPDIFIFLVVKLIVAYGFFSFFVAGLEAELYYVKEGVVNTYAMNFVVPVPASIADLEFSWQSLVGYPVSIKKKKLC